jgi:GrpB-like predicted nucleotidyltransferase (UPF0157 family)
MTLGLRRGVVRLVASQPTWPGAFHAEANRLRKRILIAGLDPLTFEHIGSTAVPGLIAKPILDLMAGYSAGGEPRDYLPVLVDAGYEHQGPQGVPGREFLVLGGEELRTHHLNLAELDGDFWRTHLWFRDRLRQDGSLAAAYAAFKQELAARYPTDREAYTAAKEPFIREVR